MRKYSVLTVLTFNQIPLELQTGCIEQADSKAAVPFDITGINLS